MAGRPHIAQRYRVIERLGQGGTAVVYRVHDVSQARDLALKQLSQPAAGREAVLHAHFEREYYVLAQLAHPSVIRVDDFGHDVDGPYYTMELLDAGDLVAGTPYPYARACQLLMQVCSALSLLHSRGFVHRDISPRNVRITASGSAKLIDFGAMVEFGPCEQVVGTPGFVAPEVVHRLELDARTDLFSVGATLYYALSGRIPFAGRTLKELAQDWGDEPTPLSELVRGIPRGLDALVMSMLRTDPARRPSTAFEVMQRLAASTGAALPESDEIARAALTAPLLVGREPQLRRFRQAVRRAIQGSGAGLVIQGASGLGRTRLLDACAIDARLSGATLLRVAGRVAGGAAFAGAHQLGVQLLEALPQLARTCAAESEWTAKLFATPEAPLRAFAANDDAHQLQTTLHAWLRSVCQRQALVIAVDDVEQLDDASLGLLVALAHGASSQRMLVVATAPEPLDLEARPALGVLLSHCTRLPLAPWSAAQNEALFASAFCGAPNVALVSDRIHKLAAGQPREALALARHMFDRALIRFTDGNWSLPAELAVSDLPASAQDALRQQLDGLPALPRRLAQAQALALDGRFHRTSYHLLAADSDAAEVDQAVALLVRLGVLSHEAGTYTLSQLSVQSCLMEQLTAAQWTGYHHALAELCAQQAAHPLCEVHHLLSAGEPQRALDRLAPLLDGNTVVAALRQVSGLELPAIVEILESAQTQARALSRSPREIHELARLLVALSSQAGSDLYYRQAPAWLAQLELDSGLVEYRATDPQLDPAKRLERALTQSAARQTPERVYRIDQAIRLLAQFTTTSIAAGSRARDTKLLFSLPDLLAPFAALAPGLYALWQNTYATLDTYYTGRVDRARSRWAEVYERLAPLSERDVPHLQELRGAIAYGVAACDVSLGNRSAEEWIALIDDDPLQRVYAQHLRRLLCICDGDVAAAEHHRKQAELWAAQSFGKMFEPPIWIELNMQMHAGDLTGVKQAADRIAPLAQKWPGWKAFDHYAQACFQWLRGDLGAAKLAFEHAMATARPEQPDAYPLLSVWTMAATDYVHVLLELGRPFEAHAFALTLIERCNALGISTSGNVVRALALAEGKLGQHRSAADRLDRSIAERVHIRPSVLALDLEARARVALWAKDASSASHFTRLATEASTVGGRAGVVKRSRLLDEAERSGVNLSVPLSDFEATVLQSQRPSPATLVPSYVLESVSMLQAPEARADRVLALLLAAAGAQTGHLYYAQKQRLDRVASLAVAPDPELDRFVDRYLQQWRVQSAMTEVFTEADDAAPITASWSDRGGTPHAIMLLQAGPAAACVGLVAFCGVRPSALGAPCGTLAQGLVHHLVTLGDLAI
ncbi:MAG TPA: protein kinase [Polyangiales bacterium]|nr:protein kinase [Polyangiales bacterium]